MDAGLRPSSDHVIVTIWRAAISVKKAFQTLSLVIEIGDIFIGRYSYKLTSPNKQSFQLLRCHTSFTILKKD